MKSETKKIWLLRWDEIKQSPTVWIILLVCLVVPFIVGTCDCIWAEYLKNLSYGYIAGMIVYALTVFLPDTKQKYEAYYRALEHLHYTNSVLGCFEEFILENRYEAGRIDPILLAGLMVNEPVAGIHLIEKGENVHVTLNDKTIAIIRICSGRLQGHIPAIMNDLKWLDENISFALTIVINIFNLLEAQIVEDHYVMNSTELGVMCENFYKAKLILAKYENKIQKYCLEDSLEIK